MREYVRRYAVGAVNSDREEHYVPFATFADWAGEAISSAWVEYLANLDQARGAASSDEVQAALQFALRSAAVETGAIEGLYATTRGITRTVAIQGALWEAELDKMGADVRGHFEAQLAAFELVLDAVTKRMPVSDKWLRELHATTTAAQKTYRVLTELGWQDHVLVHGEYKDQPNNVTLADGSTHWYAPVIETPAEVHRLVEELRSEKLVQSHPVLQAAYAHHALTAIHPFSDGNGRVARALASMFLYRGAGVPLVVFSDQQERYWDALAAADRGQRLPFVSFVEERGLDTMALISDRLYEASSPLDAQIASVRNRFRAHGGLTHAETHAVGQRLFIRVHELLGEEVGKLGLGPDVDASFNYSGVGDCTFWGRPYHLVPGSQKLEVALASRQPACRATGTVIVGLANQVLNPNSFIVIDANRPGVQPLGLRIADLYPSMSAVSEELIAGWARRFIGAMLSELENCLAGVLAREGIEEPTP